MIEQRNRPTKSSLRLPGFPDAAVFEQSPMANATTWRIGGPADLLIRASTPEQLQAAVTWGHNQDWPVTIIGGGTNLLVGDRGIRGLVIAARTPGERADDLIEFQDEGEFVRLHARAQAPLSWVGRFCSDRGWAGMEWGVGLPGAIGGATVNNAGAHGTEMIDHLRAVTIVGPDGSLVSHDREWLLARYRHTRLKDAPQPRGVAVLGVELELPKRDPAELREHADNNARYRRTTQPTGRCAGSTFTNPPGDFAGRLLEAAGLKDFAVGGVRFSTVHSNFIVNDGTGTAANVRELIALAKQRVRDQFGIELEPEIEEIGEA